MTADEHPTPGPESQRRSFLLRGSTAAAATMGAVAASVVAAPGASAAPVGAAAPVPVLLPVGPSRVYDSRKVSAGRISQGQTRRLGYPDSDGEFAHLYNLTVTQTAGSGWLAVFPGTEPWRGTSSINWWGPNQQLSNNSYTALGGDGSINVRCGSGSTHFLLDLAAVLVFIDFEAVGSIAAAGLPGVGAASARRLVDLD